MIADSATAGRAIRIGRLSPDPSLVLTLGFAAFLLLNASSLLSDPDSQWHVAIGRWIVTHGSVPRMDLFSHTYAGAPWIAKEWVSQLILYGLFALGGWSAIALGTVSIIAISFGALFAWLRRRMLWMPALVATLAAFLLYQPHFLARPHILVLPVVLAWTMSLVDALDRERAPPVWAVGLMVLWTNMHGSFPLGLVVAGVLAGEAVLLCPADARIGTAKRWLVFLTLATASTMVSPFGWRAILVPLEMSGNAETLKYVDEWHPLTFDQMGVSAIVVLLATSAILLWQWRSNLLRIVMVGLLAYLMVRHARFIGLFGLLCPLLAARTLGRLFPRRADRPDNTLDVGVKWLLAGGLTVCVATLVASVAPQPAPNITPQAAYDFARDHDIAGPVYNDYDFGGFLIAQGVKTFVDGRTDQLFLDGFLPRLDRAIRSPSDAAFAALLDKYKVTWALTATHSPAALHLAAMPHWSSAYQDKVATVYVRDPRIDLTVPAR